jgi:hypothetical protein
MSIETNLRTLLLAQSSITTLVPAQTIGGTSYPGIFDEHPVQGFKPPFILISLIDDDPMLTLGTTGGLEKTSIDIDCYAFSKPAAYAIGSAVKAFLQDYKGAAGTGTISAVEYQGRRYDAIYEAQGRDVREHIVSLNFEIYHS